MIRTVNKINTQSLSASAIAAIKHLADSKDIFIKLDKMFRNCHALVVKNRHLSDYEWMCELDETIHRNYFRENIHIKLKIE
jgi:hypothetical protein